MKIGEFHALLGEPVDMRRLDIGVTVATHLVEALVVRENEYHIRLVRRRQLQCICEAKQGGDQPPKKNELLLHSSSF